MTVEEIIKILKLASSRDMLKEVTLEISEEFTRYDEKTGLTVQDAAPEGYLTKKIAKKVYNQLYEPINEVKLSELAKKTWDDKDYTVAILPQKEKDLLPIYTLGFNDGYLSNATRE